MPPPPPSDDALLARLNALKPSSVKLSTAPPPLTSEHAAPPSSSSAPAATEQTTDPVLDLAARFKRLNSGSPRPRQTSSASDPVAEDADGDFGGEGKSLDELLRELGGEEWDMGKAEERDVGALVRDVRRVLPSVGEGQKAAGKSGGEKKRDEDEVGEEGDEEEEEEEGRDERDADEYVARVLAELDIAEKYGEDHEGDDGTGAKENRENTEDTGSQDAGSDSHHTEQPAPGEHEAPSLSLPAAPTSLPASPLPSNDDEFNEMFTARLAALSSPSPSSALPSAPTFSPAKKPVIKTSKTHFSEEEIDSWCIICYADATLRCLGCDGDLYCQKCWNEGHKGEGAGFEERSHRALQFVKGKGRKKVSLGAG